MRFWVLDCEYKEKESFHFILFACSLSPRRRRESLLTAS